MSFFISGVSLDSVNSLANTAFSLTMSYDIAWSDRYAVHPCGIGLYNYGEGVPSRGKTVDSNEWWKPEPSSEGFSSLNTSHAQNLFVLHSLGNGTGSISAGETVTSVCTSETCPWPKQLFLKESVSLTFTRPYALDLSRFPFDEQTLKTRIHMLESNGFAHHADYLDSSVHFTLPSASDNQNTADSISITGWTVTSLRMYPDPNYPRALIVELRATRDAIGVIFKCVIPVVANAVLICLVSTAGLSTRLQVLALSVVAAAAMMDPSFLGLPRHVEGVPFVQSLIIIHLIVVLAFLCYTMQGIIQDNWYELKVEDAEKAHKASLIKTWQMNSSIFQKWAGKLNMSTTLTVAERDEQPVGATNSETVLTMGSSESIFIQAQAQAHPDQGGGTTEVNAISVSDPKGEDGVLDSATLLRAQAELLLCMPALFHRQDATRHSSIWTPFNELRPGILPKYNQKLQARSELNRKMIWIVPLTYVVMWTFDLILYFAIVQPVEPSVE
jgi:hypothetical protein